MRFTGTSVVVARPGGSATSRALVEVNRASSCLNGLPKDSARAGRKARRVWPVDTHPRLTIMSCPTKLAHDGAMGWPSSVSAVKASQSVFGAAVIPVSTDRLG